LFGSSPKGRRRGLRASVGVDLQRKASLPSLRSTSPSAPESLRSPRRVKRRFDVETGEKEVF